MGSSATIPRKPIGPDISAERLEQGPVTVDESKATPEPDGTNPAYERAPAVGVLFVHGAGDHAIGSTLVEFGEPLISWLEGWLSAGDDAPTSQRDSVRPGATQIVVREADSA